MDHTVGDAATTVGVSPKAIRLWEAKGLLAAAERTEAGYRLFTDHDIEILRFIRNAKTLGLTLQEIKNILDLQRHGAAPCDRVTTLLEERIRDIDHSLADLRALRATLATVRQAAREDPRRGHTATIFRIIETPEAHPGPAQAGR
jgi:MerR family transcriptional regulator, copper efflux regulator